MFRLFSIKLIDFKLYYNLKSKKMKYKVKEY